MNNPTSVSELVMVIVSPKVNTHTHIHTNKPNYIRIQSYLFYRSGSVGIYLTSLGGALPLYSTNQDWQQRLRFSLLPDPLLNSLYKYNAITLIYVSGPPHVDERFEMYIFYVEYIYGKWISYRCTLKSFRWLRRKQVRPHKLSSTLKANVLCYQCFHCDGG